MNKEQAASVASQVSIHYQGSDYLSDIQAAECCKCDHNMPQLT